MLDGVGLGGTVVTLSTGSEVDGAAEEVAVLSDVTAMVVLLSTCTEVDGGTSIEVDMGVTVSATPFEVPSSWSVISKLGIGRDGVIGSGNGDNGIGKGSWALATKNQNEKDKHRVPNIGSRDERREKDSSLKERMYRAERD
jgi:hypothetical protein